jgi:nitrous oxidase accessory protein NosD
MNAAARKVMGYGNSLTNCVFVNCGVGVYAEGQTNLRLEGNSFKGCGTAIKAEECDGLIALNNTFSGARSMPKKIAQPLQISEWAPMSRRFLNDDALIFCIKRLRD